MSVKKKRFFRVIKACYTRTIIRLLSNNRKSCFLQSQFLKKLWNLNFEINTFIKKIKLIKKLTLSKLCGQVPNMNQNQTWITELRRRKVKDNDKENWKPSDFENKEYEGPISNVVLGR